MKSRSCRIVSKKHLFRFGWRAATAVAVLCATAVAQASLEDYDAAITADATAGLTPAATLTTPVTLNGAAGSAFNFGSTSGDASIEFIIEGNPTASESSFLAVGSATASSLRYNSWGSGGQLGFTQGGVADYLFTPAVPAPSKSTHVAYVWDPATTTMKVYVNGALAGTTTGASAAFVMPSGQGFLGSSANGTEVMTGTFHRVTVYDTVLNESAIARHANAYGGLVEQGLAAYDKVIAADATGGLTPLSLLTNAVTLTGQSEPFDFGYSSGDVSMEFILTGDAAVTNTSFLAVGEATSSSLRYELWNNTGNMGFTQGGVADYTFSPAVPSPTQPTHVTYVWNSASLTMSLYLNGNLAGTTTNVDANFVMPYGFGYLGNNPGGTEPMFGRIHRVTIYDDIIPDATILKHAKSFTDVIKPPLIKAFAAATNSIQAGQSTVLTWTVENATSISINGLDVTALPSLTVKPQVTTTYIIVAKNSFGDVSTKTGVTVQPPLSAYDAVITADATAGTAPLAKLTTPVSLDGSAGVPFNFGEGSGDVSMEFIVEGDTSANAGSYLAVGAVSTSNLRFEVWGLPGQAGFTQIGVLDYGFNPPVPASSWPTHLTYVWNSTDLTMKAYVNGTLAGTTTNVAFDFTMPWGDGMLGANLTGGEAMVGTIFRVNVYQGQLPEATILKHADAFMAAARPDLHAYDLEVRSSSALARLLSPHAMRGDSGVGFFFGNGSGDVTMEFILEGDPSASESSTLAVGTNSASILRYEPWGSGDQIGFTQIAVNDYTFTPGIPSPVVPTHFTYVYNPATATVKGYVNGVLAGTVADVSTAFNMPQDLGSLGAYGDGGEPMIGTIYRVTVYDTALADDVILKHAESFASFNAPPKVAAKVANNTVSITLTGKSGAHYRVEYRNSFFAADSWQLLQDVPSLSGTTITVDDTTPVSSLPQRLYRAVMVQ